MKVTFDPPARVLVVDDDKAARELLLRLLTNVGYEVVCAADGDEATLLVEPDRFDLVLSDIRMGKTDGYAVLASVRAKAPETPVVLLTAFGDIDGAMEAIRQGAYDYLSKPYQIDGLKQVCERAISVRRLTQENRLLKRSLKEKYHLASIVGRSSAMLEVYKMVARVAPSTVSVLISGESGTGKELVARAIHGESPRAQKPFVAVNCGALAEGVLESELFGHERGAFTGATGARAGLFEEASGGTLFLDEIHSISPKMQTQLLRVLQEGEIRKVGSSRTQQVDVRILAATNTDLATLAVEDKFREDLYYRLNVVSIHLPPLRSRREDIPLLVEHFLARHERETGRSVGMTPEALECLMRYEWHGNVRELENTIARAVVLCRGGFILPSDLPVAIHNAVEPLPQPAEGVLAGRPTLEELSVRYARLVLAEEGGNKSKTATILGIDRKTLYRLLDEKDG